MAAKLSSFSPHPSILSPFLKKPPDAVPPTDELDQLNKELKLAKEKALERSKKASDDLKTIEESIRRMTEREKGKFKAIDKIKRERDCTYMLLMNYFEKFLTYGLWMHTLLPSVVSSNVVHLIDIFTACQNIDGRNWAKQYLYRLCREYACRWLSTRVVYLCRYSSSRCTRVQKLNPISRAIIKTAYKPSSYQRFT